MAVPRPAVARVEAHYLAADDVAKFLAAAKTSRFWAPLALIAGTGLRRGEALALRWSDVDLDTSTIRVRGTLARIGGVLTVTEPKTQRSRRTIRLSPGVNALLVAHRKVQVAERLRAANAWTEADYVFTTETGQVMDPRNLLRATTAAAAKAGLTSVSVHTLRHSAASMLLEAGIGLKTVSEMLGHSSVAITGDIYQHVSDNAAQQAADALSAAIGL